ncbi:hypothetical protein H8356DRAFT_1356368 [Neocallimastix lanati (nom. inval.)]|nr:hypothetical protein H8356DRAFT_1356368 [Neocallimastix sp. JGI-2020a]
MFGFNSRTDSKRLLFQLKRNQQSESFLMNHHYLKKTDDSLKYIRRIQLRRSDEGNLYKMTEQLVEMMNSSNERSNPHFDYYKKYLNLMLGSINFKGVHFLLKNISMFRFIVKWNNYNLNQSDNTSN